MINLRFLERLLAAILYLIYDKIGIGREKRWSETVFNDASDKDLDL